MAGAAADPKTRALDTKPVARKRSLVFLFRSTLEWRGYTQRNFRSRFSYSAALRAASPRTRSERPRGKADLAWVGLWEAISNGGEIGPDDEAAILACERWRRKVRGERNDLWTRLASTFRHSHADWARLTTGIRRGVPSSLRGSVWYACSGAATKRQESSRSYAELVELGLELKNEAATVIEVDLPRTGVEPHQMPQLRSVLRAFAAKNPSIGYCQSMNFLAKTLLLYNGEERTFWMLCSLIEDMLPADYYTQTMSGLRSDLKLLDSLIGQYLPNLKHHLVQRGIDLAPITMNWFLCLFVNTLPAEKSHRVLDCLLHEGPKVLFRAALSILHIREAELLKAEAVVDAYAVLRAPFGSGGPREAGGGHGASPAAATGGDLLGSMYGLWLKGLSTDRVVQLREAHLGGVRAEDAAHAARREAWRQAQAAPKPGADARKGPDAEAKAPRVPEAPEPEAEELRAEASALIDRLPAQRQQGLGFQERAPDSPQAAASWLAAVTGDEVDEAGVGGTGAPGTALPGFPGEEEDGEDNAKSVPVLLGDTMEGALYEEDDEVLMEASSRGFGAGWLCCQRRVQPQSPFFSLADATAGGCCKTQL